MTYRIAEEVPWDIDLEHQYLDELAVTDRDTPQQDWSDYLTKIYAVDAHRRHNPHIA